MTAVQEAEIAGLFNHMFLRVSAPGERGFDNLLEDLDSVAGNTAINEELHHTLAHVALAAGSGKPEYGAVSRAFTELAELTIARINVTDQDMRYELQEDACSLLVYAEVAAPRQDDGRVAPAYAAPIIDTALRLLDTRPDPLVEDVVNASTDLLDRPLPFPPALRQAARQPAPHLDALARAAQRTLQRHMQ